jgi:hypothetical protein
MLVRLRSEHEQHRHHQFCGRARQAGRRPAQPISKPHQAGRQAGRQAGTHQCCRSASSLCSRSTWPSSSRPRGRRLQRHRGQRRGQADAHSGAWPPGQASIHTATEHGENRRGAPAARPADCPVDCPAKQAPPRMAATVTRGEVYRRARKRLLTTQNSLQQQHRPSRRQTGGSAPMPGVRSLLRACWWCCSQAEPPNAPPAAPAALPVSTHL